MRIETAISELISKNLIIPRDINGQKMYEITRDGGLFIVKEAQRAIKAMAKNPHLKLQVPFDEAVTNFVNKMVKDHKGAAGALIFAYQQSHYNVMELQTMVDFDVDCTCGKQKGVS